MRVEWRVYYGDGSTFDNLQGGPQDAPKRNVQIIAQADPIVGVNYPRSADYYWWTEMGWQSGDIFGWFDYLIEPGWKVTLFGRTIPTLEWQQIQARAQSDPDMPRKSGWHEWERKS